MADTKKDTKARKYQITIEEPTKHNIDHTIIKEKLLEFKSVAFWCMGDEIGGKTQKYHTHIFIVFNDVVRFSQIKNKFPPAHIEGALKGSCQQNIDYITKKGKWLNSDKQETSLPQTYEEWGVLPFERQGTRHDVTEQYDMVKQGMSNFEILEQFDGNVDLTRVERMRLTYLSETYKSVKRDEMKVYYCYGKPGTGKTSSIFDKHGYDNVYKIDEWEHPFDSYDCQSIMLFDDWRHTLTKITDMLKWLDIYPLKLPCRYAPKQACYETVYITSNEPLESVYAGENTTIPIDTRNALLRRIHYVRIYHEDYSYTEYTTQDYLNRKNTEFFKIDDQIELPWKFD